MNETRLDGSVLIVDDEPSIRRGCQRVLEACGAQVTLAATGDEGVRALTGRPFDVAIIDLVMPDFGGMEVLEKIAAAEVEAVSIVITAHASIETAVQAVKHGAFDYLPKPFVPVELIVRVERALKWRRLRQEAERHLLELDTDKTRLRTIVNSLADGVIVGNIDGQAVLVNPAARAALGTEVSLAEPRPLQEVIPDERLADLIRSATEGPAEAGVAFTSELRSGGRIFMARVVPVRAAQGQALGTATVLRDVTELMSLERAKAQFVSMVAHELKAPLAAVQGYLQVMMRKQELPPGKQEEMVARCSARIEGMTQLVRDLLDLSQADALPARRIEPQNLAEIAAEVVELNSHLAEPNNITVAAEIPTDCPPVLADRDDLSRMVTNLVTNAIKYNRPGGRVTIGARVDGEWLRIEVTDAGLGIPPEALPRLGDEFFRINLPDRRGIVGTGLGLSLVKRIAEVYHGRLEVESTLGEGSTFSLVLPL